jgi:chemotaxis protein histidine kinase CheA
LILIGQPNKYGSCSWEDITKMTQLSFQEPTKLAHVATISIFNDGTVTTSDRGLTGNLYKALTLVVGKIGKVVLLEKFCGFSRKIANVYACENRLFISEAKGELSGQFRVVFDEITRVISSSLTVTTLTRFCKIHRSKNNRAESGEIEVHSCNVNEAVQPVVDKIKEVCRSRTSNTSKIAFVFFDVKCGLYMFCRTNSCEDWCIRSLFPVLKEAAKKLIISSTTEAKEPAQPTTEVKEPAQPTTEAKEPAQPTTEVKEPAQPTTEVKEAAQPTTEVKEAAQPTTEVKELVQPTTEAKEPAQPTTEAKEPAQPTTEAKEPAQPTTEAKEPAQSAPEAKEPAQPTTEAKATAQPTMEAKEESTPISAVKEVAPNEACKNPATPKNRSVSEVKLAAKIFVKEDGTVDLQDKHLSARLTDALKKLETCTFSECAPFKKVKLANIYLLRNETSPSGQTAFINAGKYVGFFQQIRTIFDNVVEILSPLQVNPLTLFCSLEGKDKRVHVTRVDKSELLDSVVTSITQYCQGLFTVTRKVAFTFLDAEYNGYILCRDNGVSNWCQTKLTRALVTALGLIKEDEPIVPKVQEAPTVLEVQDATPTVPKVKEPAQSTTEVQDATLAVPEVKEPAAEMKVPSESAGEDKIMKEILADCLQANKMDHFDFLVARLPLPNKCAFQELVKETFFVKHMSLCNSNEVVHAMQQLVSDFDHLLEKADVGTLIRTIRHMKNTPK